MPPVAVPETKLGTVAARPIQAQENITADAGSFGGLQAQALQAAGAKLQTVSDDDARQAVIFATDDNETAAKAADTSVNDQLRTMLFDPASGYFTKKGSDAVDAYTPTMISARKLIDDTASKIDNLGARKMFQDIAARRLDNTLNSMAQHAAIERRTYIDGVSTARADSAGQDAIAFATDPAKREANLNIGRAEIVTFGRDHGEGPEVTDAKLRAFNTKAYVGAIQNLSVSDPIAAAKLYEEIKPKINGDAQGPLESFLKGKVEKYQATSDADSAMGQGASEDYGRKVGARENGGNYGGTPNASTNAGGRYGFTDATFLDHARKGAVDETLGKSDAEILALKNSNTPEGRALQDKAFSHLTRDNEAALKAAGLPVNDTTRYMTHWFGSAGGVAILKADPSTPIEKFLPAGKGADGKMRTPDQWAQENGVKGMTVGQVISATGQRMGTATTKLPDEGGIANAQTWTDPKVVEEAMRQNLGQWLTNAQAIADPARRDSAVAEIKKRYELQTLQVAAANKANELAAWKIAVTPTQAGSRGPVSQDAIPMDMWVKLDPKVQELLTRQFEHNAKGTEPPDNPKLFYELNREALDNPDAFRARNLYDVKAALPNHRWDNLVELQRSITKADAKEYKITDAMRVAERSLRLAGFDLSATARDSDKEVLGQFQSGLQDWLSQYQEVNKKPPQQKDVLAHVDQMLIQGRIRGEGYSFLGDRFIGTSKQVEGPKSQKGQRGSLPNHTFNFQVAPASRGSFYVPYDEIPARERAWLERNLIERKLLKPAVPPSGDVPGSYEMAPTADRERQKVIENYWGAILAGSKK